MNKKLQYSLLAILPVLLFVFSSNLRQAQGPLYQNTLYDPVYVYLINSLNLAQFLDVAHVDHPGTPVQVIGAIVIKASHLIKATSSNIAEDVLKDPETYINAILITLALINSFVLLVFGISVSRTTGNIFAGLLLQLSPFVSFTIFYELSVITAENFLISVILLLMAISFSYIYKEIHAAKNFYFVICFSIVCGLGIATKITFIPLLIIPFVILKGLKKKLIFLTLTFIFFVIFVLPAISNYDYFVDWVKNLFIFDGKYGKGNPKIVDAAGFITHFGEILFFEKFFTFSYLLILIFIVIAFFTRRKRPHNKSEFKFLVSIFLAMSFQLLIVSKHYSGHYMVPALMLCIPGLYLIISISLKTYFTGYDKKKLNYILLSLCLIIFSLSAFEIVKHKNVIELQKDEAVSLNKFISDNYPGARVISSYGSSSKEYALAFSTKWAGSQKTKYMSYLNTLYPDNLFYEFWDDRIYSFSDPKVEGDIINHGQKLLFQNKYPKSNEKIISDMKAAKILDNPELIKVYDRSNGETVYEVNSVRDSTRKE